MLIRSLFTFGRRRRELENQLQTTKHAVLSNVHLLRYATKESASACHFSKKVQIHFALIYICRHSCWHIWVRGLCWKSKMGQLGIKAPLETNGAQQPYTYAGYMGWYIQVWVLTALVAHCSRQTYLWSYIKQYQNNHINLVMLHFLKIKFVQLFKGIILT